MALTFLTWVQRCLLLLLSRTYPVRPSDNSLQNQAATVMRVVKQYAITEKPDKTFCLQRLIGYSSFCFTEKASL
nr:hypothetical protein HUO10_004305 [Paraburkholderia busanensis]